MARTFSTTEVLTTPGRVRTVGDIARHLGVTRDRVRYAISTGGISPTCRIGNYPCFSDAAVLLIQQRLTEISSRANKAA